MGELGGPAVLILFNGEVEALVPPADGVVDVQAHGAFPGQADELLPRQIGKHQDPVGVNDVDGILQRVQNGAQIDVQTVKIHFRTPPQNFIYKL